MIFLHHLGWFGRAIARPNHPYLDEVPIYKEPLVTCSADAESAKSECKEHQRGYCYRQNRCSSTWQVAGGTLIGIGPIRAGAILIRAVLIRAVLIRAVLTTLISSVLVVTVTVVVLAGTAVTVAISVTVAGINFIDGGKFDGLSFLLVASEIL